MNGCVHHWRCERGESGKVPAVCLKCGAETSFEPKFLDGHSALEGTSPWAGPWEEMGHAFGWTGVPRAQRR